jgi:[ribosomal protein S18]-alanine N-acetyltransferase
MGKRMASILHPAIRAFCADDLAGVLRIERASFGRDAFPRELFLRYAAASPRFFLIARVSGRIAAYCIATFTPHGAEIDSLAVLPRHRKLGIATALMKAMIRKLRRFGVRVITLLVRRKNTAAIRLYRSLGFVRVSTIAHYYPGGATAWRMRLAV